jgi:hypothetical protein
MDGTDARSLLALEIHCLRTRIVRAMLNRYMHHVLTCLICNELMLGFRGCLVMLFSLLTLDISRVS